MAFSTFKYNGRWVTGIKDMTRGQYWFTYGPILAWSLFALFLIVANAICDCVGFYTWTFMPYLVWSVASLVWTYFVRRQVNRRNYEYEK